MPTISEIDSSSFPLTFLFKGYNRQEVNDYFEAVRFVLNKNRADLHSSEIKCLLNPVFNTTVFGIGYGIQDVDDLVNNDVDNILKENISRLEKEES